jgi:hypothetical protein
MTSEATNTVSRFSDSDRRSLSLLLDRYGLVPELVDLNMEIQGSYWGDEENAVCYLQILLADELPGFGREQMLSDMDAWGYTFRLGSARAWFEEDAGDAGAWLIATGIISTSGKPTFKIRE